MENETVTPKTESIGQDNLTKLTSLAEQFTGARDRKREVEAQLKAVNEELENLQDTMVELMQANDVDQIAVRGRIYYPYVQSFPSVLDQDRFYAWLEDHAEDGIIKRTIHPSTLRAWYKEKEDQFGEELVSDNLVKVFEKQKIGDRKR